MPEAPDSAVAPVSIVIPCHSYGRFLREAIDSVLAQTRPPQEILVADDGSTDETAAVADALAPRVRHLRLERVGQVRARQAALDLVRTEYVLNLDADDRLPPTFLERTLAAFAGNPDPDVAYIYTHERRFGREDRIVRNHPYDLQVLKRGNHIALCSLFRTGAIRRAGFDPRFVDGWSDYDLLLSLAEIGFRGVLADDAWFERRMHDSSITATVVRTRSGGRLMRRILHKHARLYAPREWRRQWAWTWCHDVFEATVRPRAALRRILGLPPPPAPVR